MDDVVDQKIFKYKYRHCNDDDSTHARRQGRVLARFTDRAKLRDPALETDLFALYQEDMKDASVAQFMLDPANFKSSATEKTRVFRDYMVQESLNQYRDYYETDAEEQQFFQYMDNLSNRDKIRFTEIFKDYTEFRADQKDYVMIQKREYNPELSLFANLALDLVDFKDRVRPLARDMALLDVTRPLQKNNVDELLKERQQLHTVLKEVEAQLEKEAIEEGYSSRELEGPDSKRNRRQ